MLNKSILIAALMTVVACSKEGSGSKSEGTNKVMALGAYGQDVELTIRSRAGGPENYHTSTFSFFHLSRKVEVTRNSWDLQASPGNMPGEDEFQTNMVVGDFGLITDMGEMSCNDIPNKYEQQGEYPGIGKGGYPHKKHRQTDPRFWFGYSEAHTKIHEAKDNRAVIKKGHCYSIFKLASDTKVVAVFGVKDYVPGKTVTLTEIEVFDRARVK